MNSREKANNSRILGKPPYIDGRLAAAPDSHKIPEFALRPNSSTSCAPGFRFRKSWAGA